MFDRPPREKEAWSWGLAFLWAGLTFVTVPYVRGGVVYVNENIGQGFFTYAVVVLVIMAAAWALYGIRHRLTLWSGIWLIGIAGLIVYLAMGLAGGSPVEAVHYVQYGTLSVLLFRAFSHRIRDYSIYVAVTLAGTCAGMIDETIQWLTPDRVFDLRDVWLNFKATALVQIGVAAGIRPKLISGWPGWASLRRLCYLGAITLGYLGLCLQNTSDRVVWYTSKVPALAFIDPSRNIMVEYGYLHGDAANVIFRSRLTSEDLQQAVARHSDEGTRNFDDLHAEALQGNSNLRELLMENPYLYEGRLHQLVRNRHLESARTSEGGRQAQQFAAAYWENVILERHFSELLRGTRYEWSPDEQSEVTEGADLDVAFESTVSRHLIVAFQPHQLAFLSVGGVVLLLLAALFCGRASRQRSGI